MKKITKLCLVLLAVGLISCGPSPKSLAKKYCDLSEKYKQAETDKDSSKMSEYLAQMAAMDMELLKKYQHANPELLYQYVKLKAKCEPNSPDQNNLPQ